MYQPGNMTVTQLFLLQPVRVSREPILNPEPTFTMLKLYYMLLLLNRAWIPCGHLGLEEYTYGSIRPIILLLTP